MFQLVFKGERTGDVDEPTARANAMTLFKATIAQVERMFSGQRVVIRNQLDQVTAQKYQALLRKHGLVAHVESMAPAAAESAQSEPGSRPQAAAPDSQPAVQGAQPTQAETGRGVEVEPGERLPVAGDKVDQILSHSSLSIAQPGVRLSDATEAPSPHFDHLDDLTLAPVGTDLAEPQDTVPVAEPDISHLSLLDEDTDKPV